MRNNNDWMGTFGSTRARAGGNYFKPGTYECTLMNFKKFTSANPATKGHVMVAVEVKVDRVVMDYAADPGDGTKDGGWGASNITGDTVSTVVNLTKGGATAEANLKAALLATIRARAVAAGAKPPEEEDLTAEQWEGALVAACDGAGTTFAGARLRVTATKTRTKAGRPFTPLSWSELAAPAPAAA